MAAIAAIARIAFVQLTFVLVVLSAITCDLAKVSCQGFRRLHKCLPRTKAYYLSFTFGGGSWGGKAVKGTQRWQRRRCCSGRGVEFVHVTLLPLMVY